MRTWLAHTTTLIVSLLVMGYAASCNAGYSSTQFDKPQDMDVDVSRLKPGEYMEIAWNDFGVLIYRRTNKDLQHLKNNFKELADPYNNELAQTLQIAAYSQGNAFSSLLKPTNEKLAINPLRAIDDEFLVIELVSRYVGCAISVVPEGDKRFPQTWRGGFFDPCRDVKYDLSGRVLKGHKQGMNLNLLVLPHRFESSNKLVIGIGQSSIRKLDFRPNVVFLDLPPDQRLVTAAELGLLDQVIAAARAGANINAKDGRGVTALFMAASEGGFEVNKWLLENGANPNLRNTRWGTPACQIAIVGNEALIRLFGLFGADWDSVQERDPNCEEPRIIWSITKTGSEEDALRRIQVLVEAGSNPAVTHLGNLPSTTPEKRNIEKSSSSCQRPSRNAPARRHDAPALSIIDSARIIREL